MICAICDHPLSENSELKAVGRTDRRTDGNQRLMRPSARRPAEQRESHGPTALPVCRK